MAKNSMSFNNMPFAPVSAALTNSTEKDGRVMINRCSAWNFERSKHLRADHTGVPSQACITFHRSNTEMVGSNSSRDINVYRRFFCVCVVLYTYRPCDEPTHARGLQQNVYKQDPERWIRSSVV
jgi:hypothetical protein